MEILGDKYLSPDEVRQIAHRTDPETIIPLCRSNKLLRRLCEEDNFWINYINGDQKKYYDLMLALASGGNLKIFLMLWNDPPGVVRERKLLVPAFHLSFLNGYEEMADKIGRIYGEWQHEYVYSSDINSREYSIKNIIEEEKVYLILREAIVRKDINYAKEIMKEWTTRGLATSSPVERAIAHAANYKLYYTLLKAAENMKYTNNYIQRENIINRMLSYGSLELAQEIMTKYNPMRIDIFKALASYRTDSLDFVRMYYKDEEIAKSYFSSYIGNRETVFELLNISENEDSEIFVLTKSFKAFGPYEYVDLLIERVGCITEFTFRQIIYRLKKDGEDYMVKVFEEEMPVC
jgi:hypothetical protein